ncbi:MAG: Trk family potassium uptake protein [Clostridia bacterium]|nr:Trk family potassium uptake protein [Clostridia bacterium]
MKFKILSPFRVILAGFALLILLGAFLLSLPISSAEGVPTPFSDALFTSASAVCVTGLVVRDTATYWSAFAQGLILALIQIGGLGVVTMTVGLTLVTGKKLGLSGRSTLQESTSAPTLGSIMSHTGFIFKATLVIEFSGALLLMPAFVRDHGWRGVWMSVFHSISAFCNAGFDVSGNYASLTAYSSDPLVNVPVILLIVIGGLGFLTYRDVLTHGLRFKKYSLQSKVVIVTTAVLLIIPAVFFFFFDFSKMPLGERIWCSLFQSVTARTAGFNTADQSLLSSNGRVLMTVLMLTGGSPGSTAGGMKTTTLALLFAAAFGVFGKRSSTKVFSRRVPDETVRTASTLLLTYLILFLIGGCAISALDSLPLGDCLFESASAVGTVGLSLGITGLLGTASKLIVTALMFVGRVGGLTVIYAALGTNRTDVEKYPVEKITVG